MIRTGLLAFAAIVAWFLARQCDGRPDPQGLDAPATEFSAARADAVLGRILGPELPHPISSDEAANVRARLQQELEVLGVATTIHEGTGCYVRPAAGVIACGTVKNVIAEVVPGTGPAIVMLAHYDSVPAGPGAADDASGVAAIIETVRALKARSAKSRHPILAVITDGEEAGLLGADALLDSAEFRARVGVVVNLEARGNTGPSLLFQTSAGDSPLIDVYKRSVDTYATSSLFAVIYRLLPNDTDLTPFLAAKIPAFNFAFSENLPHYHTPLDNRENLDRSTLQHHGDNLLGVVSSLQTTPLESLRGGEDDVYVTIFGIALPRMPIGWTVPLAALALVLLGITAFLSRTGTRALGATLRAIAIVPAMLVGSAVFGWLLYTIASLVSGQADPSYAHPALMRLGLAAGVVAIFVCCSRLADTRRSALAIWLWMGVLALVTALLVPGFSPYFLFPTLVASVLLLAQARTKKAWTGRIGQLAIAASAVLPVVLWISLAAVGESVQGLVLHPMFTVPAAFGTLALIPLASAEPGSIMGGLSKRAWRYAAAGTAAVAVLLSVLQGTRPAFSEASPQRLNLVYLDDASRSEAFWIASSPSPLPPSLRAAAQFSSAPVDRASLFRRPVYVASAGKPRFPAPVVRVTEQPSATGRTVTLGIEASGEMAQLMVSIPADAGARAVTIYGERHELPPGVAFPLKVRCMSRDCARTTIALEAGTSPFNVTVAAIRFGLPPDALKLVAARPKTAVPSQDGDTTIVSTQVHVNGR